jgi:hypothetical protein
MENKIFISTTNPGIARASYSDIGGWEVCDLKILDLRGTAWAWVDMMSG